MGSVASQKSRERVRRCRSTRRSMLAQQQWRVLVVLVCGGVLSLVECLAMRCGCTELADRSVILGKALAGCHLAGLWWLRGLVQARRRPSAPLLQGLKAGYQVVWASAVLTHICILTRRMSGKYKMVFQSSDGSGGTCKGAWGASVARSSPSPALSTSLRWPVFQLLGLAPPSPRKNAWAYPKTLSRKLDGVWLVKCFA